MSEDLHPWASFLLELFSAAAAQRGLSAEATAQLARATHQSIIANTSIDKGFGWRSDWQKQMRLDKRNGVLRGLTNGEPSERLAARNLHRKIRRYRAASFDRDASATSPPAGEREALFNLLTLTGGKVPSEGSCRAWIRAARRPG